MISFSDFVNLNEELEKQIIPGETGHRKRYINERELPAAIEEVVGKLVPVKPGVIGLLYAKKYIALEERVVLQLDMNDVYGYREYDRRDLNNSKHSEDSFDKLYQDIAANGIKEPLIMNYWRSSGTGNVKAFLGEGNHRVLIAKMLGLSTVPVRFFYTSGPENY